MSVGSWDNAAKVVEDGHKAVDSALAVESSKAIGLKEQLVGANAKINCLDGQISSMKISRQFDVAAKFKAEAFQQANDQLNAQVTELRQKLDSDLEVQSSQMKIQYERSTIDYINVAFAEAELQAEGVILPRLPYP